MKVAMMQPAFLPWQGYFGLIKNADVFIFLDDFQFSAQSYHQRNRLFIYPGKIGWYTVSVAKDESFLKPLNETVVNEDISWRDKIWARVVQNYTKAPFFNDLALPIKECLFAEYKSLAALNMALISHICGLLDLNTKFYYSSDFASTQKRSLRVLELLREFNAKIYLSAYGAFGYMREDGLFPVTDIEVLFENFIPSTYRQLGSKDEFIPYLSVLDALFNVGPKHTAQLIAQGVQWRSWSEMVAQECLGNTH
jgi:hypothetical protein